MTSFLFIPFIPYILFNTSMCTENAMEKNQAVTSLHRERKERRDGMNRKDGKDKRLCPTFPPVPAVIVVAQNGLSAMASAVSIYDSAIASTTGNDEQIRQ